MKDFQTLTFQNIDNVFRGSRSVSREEQLAFFSEGEQDLTSCSSSLEVKDDGILHQYVLVKVLDWDKAAPLSPSIIQPQFIIEAKNGEKYGAFGKLHLNKVEPADTSNLRQLKVILKNLAKTQAKYCSVNEVDNTHIEYILENVAKQVTSLSHFQDIDQTEIDTALENLQRTADKLAKTLNLIVQSQWFSNNIYISSDNSNVVVLQTSSGQLLSPAYDAVFLIFSLSNEKFRQDHFEDLMDYYFQSLAQALRCESSELADKITEEYIESQINVLLPIVKLALISNIVHDENSEPFKKLATNLKRYLKFYHLHQEDIYHAIKVKLSSTDYDLLNYSLERLGESNGHLGDYFNVKVAVQFQNREENFQLFAKIIFAESEALSEIIDSGIAEKETFFYRTLHDLSKLHGLHEIMDFAPKCYMCGFRGLILDDLSSMGYRALAPNALINFEEFQTVLDQLAKFHATSVILEERLSEKAGHSVRFDCQYPQMFNENIIMQTGSMGEWMNNRFKSIFVLLEKMSEFKKDLGFTDKEIEERLQNIRTRLFKDLQSSTSLRNFINHGDMYVSNMLFKMGGDSSILDGKLIDFQMLRYLPPALEVQFFITVAASKETRYKYEKVLQYTYYESLSKYLKKFQLDPEAIYSRKHYEEDLRNTKASALLVGEGEQDLTSCSSSLEVKDDGILHQYVLVKVLDWDKAAPLSPSIIQPQFIIEAKNGEKYGAFGKLHLNKVEPADTSNLRQLKVILKNLAKTQAKYCSVNEVDNTHIEYILENVAKQVTSLSHFQDIDQTEIDTALENLQRTADKLAKTLNLIVQSQWFSNNIYISSDNSNVVVLQTSSGQLLSPAYDAVFLIFSLSNEKFRQDHFEDLMDYCFQSLTQALRCESSELADKITEEYIESQINVLLPIVKLALISNIVHDENSEPFKKLATNLKRYLKFYHLHQEDIYHAIKVKLSSTDYDLLNYSLERLGESNGHLGDYFNVKVAVRFQNKKENFQLFAKIIFAESEALSEIIDSGIAEKETFFYRTLHDLSKLHGLHEIMDFAPKCYMCGFRSLILDDLSSMGYRALAPNALINLEEFQTVLDQLAKFHATSVILEERLSEKAGHSVRFDCQYPQMFNENIVMQTGSMGEWMNNRFKSIFVLLGKMSEFKKELGLTDKEIEERLQNIRTRLFKDLQSSTSLRNFINHGDMYVGNMLFKMGGDSSILDGKLIDFQMLRYLPPALEVQFFITVASSKETRYKYEKVPQDTYYESLSKYLKKFQLDPKAIYSRKHYEEDLQNTKASALLVGYFYACFVSIDPDFKKEIMHDIEKINYYLVNHHDKYFDVVLQNETYKQQIAGILESLVDCIKGDSWSC
ncbi:hypothetical protein HUJ04_010144 [Dendroctonus ponderosae]|nr:hypothetical protein HUJ04_010144 [Dendroctonus ponderosae]